VPGETAIGPHRKPRERPAAGVGVDRGTKGGELAVQPRVHRAHAVHRHGTAQVVGDAISARAVGDILVIVRLEAHHRPGHLPAVGGGAVLPDHLGVAM